MYIILFDEYLGKNMFMDTLFICDINVLFLEKAIASDTAGLKYSR
jgi:hypothetical protein